jgi:hypothetical protein
MAVVSIQHYKLTAHQCLMGCMQVKPAASYAGSSVTTLDFLADTFSNRNQGEPG